MPTENVEQIASTDRQQLAPEEDVPVPTEAKMPTRKDTSLKEFLSKMDDYAPIVSFDHHLIVLPRIIRR